MSPSGFAKADNETLVRRVQTRRLGLPPTSGNIDACMADTTSGKALRSPGAWNSGRFRLHHLLRKTQKKPQSPKWPCPSVSRVVLPFAPPEAFRKTHPSSEILSSAHWHPHHGETGRSPFCPESGSHSKNRQRSMTDGIISTTIERRGQVRDGATEGRPEGRDERDRASQIERIYTKGERLRRRISFSVLFVLIRKIRGSNVRHLDIRAERVHSRSRRIRISEAHSLPWGDSRFL